MMYEFRTCMWTKNAVHMRALRRKSGLWDMERKKNIKKECSMDAKDVRKFRRV